MPAMPKGHIERARVKLRNFRPKCACVGAGTVDIGYVQNREILIFLVPFWYLSGIFLVLFWYPNVTIHTQKGTRSVPVLYQKGTRKVPDYREFLDLGS